MKKIFFPDEYLNSIHDINIPYLAERGYKAIITDIDNTLEPYEESRPTEKTMNWLKMVDDYGIKVAFISNNKADRVEEFNRELNYPFQYKAHKPCTWKLKTLLDDLGSDKNNTIMLGDQIFTDVLCSRLAGMYCILVKPIRDKMTVPFIIKRALEKPILRLYLKNGEKNEK